MSAAQLALAILGVGALIAWHELGHYLLARLTGMRVLKYSIGFGPRLWGFARDGIEYRLSLIPLGGYVHIFGMSRLEPGAEEDPRAFINAPRWARIATILAGPAFNYVLAFALFWVFFFSWPGGSMVVDELTPASAAATAGLERGDRIYAIDGRQLRQERSFGELLPRRGDASLRVLRGAGDDATVHDLTLVTTLPLGAELSYEKYDVTLGESGARAASAVWLYSAKTLDALGKLVLGDKEVRESTTGPPGIVRELKEAVNRGLADFLWLLAFLNISLGLLNLLPVPALDGIKVLVLVIEGAIRREINPYAMAIVNLVGFALLLALIVLVSVKDLAKMVG